MVRSVLDSTRGRAWALPRGVADSRMKVRLLRERVAHAAASAEIARKPEA
jgi:hypothetical protein